MIKYQEISVCLTPTATTVGEEEEELEERADKDQVNVVWYEMI